MPAPYLLLLAITLYFLPWIIASARSLPAGRRGEVLFFNLFMGYTVVGWVIALIDALR